MAGSPLLVSFDFSRLRIKILGLTTLKAENDFYSDWKEQVKEQGSAAAGAPPAFDTTGGDVTDATLGQEISAYFFLRNDLGWRIEAPDLDGEVVIEGDMFPRDSTRPMFVSSESSPGTFQVLIRQVVSSKSLFTDLSTLDANVEDLAFNGAIWINTVDGTPGTAFPAGTKAFPVDNLTDAVAIDAIRNRKKFHVHGDLTLTQGFDDYEFEATTVEHSSMDVGGFIHPGTSFKNIELTGAFGIIGSPEHPMFAMGCRVATTHLTNWVGMMVSCTYAGDISFQGGRSTLLMPSSEVAGTDTPVFDRNSTPGDLNVRGLIGGFELQNFDNGDNCSIDVISGHVILGPTNTSGVVVLRGVGKFTNNLGSPTVTLNHDGFVSGEDIRIIKALTAGDADVSLDDLTVTVYDPDNITSPRTVLAVYSVSADGRIRTRTV